MKKNNPILFVALAAAISIVSVASTSMARPAAPPSHACTVALSSESLPISPDPISLHAKYSEAIGDSVTGSVPTESGVSILKMAGDPAEPQLVQLQLNTSKAAVGSYTMTLKGTKGVCTGGFKVIKAS